jgi:haloalkane dehalogenase
MTTMNAAWATGLFRTPPDRLLDVGNGQVALRSVGEGPDVLLVHGWPVSGATFRGLLPHLAPHLRCHVVDLVGSGDSAFDRTARIGVADHAEALRRVVDSLGLDDVAVVGHDSGGMIARHALAGDPRVRAWGLLDTEQPQGPSWRFRAFQVLRHVPRFEHLLARVANNRRLRRHRLVLGDCFNDRDLLDGDFADFFLAPLREEDRRWAAGEFLRRFDPGPSFGALRALHARIRVPVQVVQGEDDPFFPLAWTKDMLATFGGPADLHVVERGRLFTHEEFAHETAEALLPTLLGR